MRTIWNWLWKDYKEATLVDWFILLAIIVVIFITGFALTKTGKVEVIWAGPPMSMESI
jgi:hypothetical protein